MVKYMKQYCYFSNIKNDEVNLIKLMTMIRIILINKMKLVCNVHLIVHVI